MSQLTPIPLAARGYQITKMRTFIARPKKWMFAIKEYCKEETVKVNEK